MSEPAEFERFPYPRGLVVGVLASEADVARSQERLREAGFAEDHQEVLHGQQDARSLDIKGESHGVGGRLIRALQKMSSYDLEYMRVHADHLRAGDYVVAVAVGQDGDGAERAAAALRAAGSSSIDYFADDYVESFDEA